MLATAILLGIVVIVLAGLLLELYGSDQNDPRER